MRCVSVDLGLQLDQQGLDGLAVVVLQCLFYLLDRVAGAVYEIDAGGSAGGRKGVTDGAAAHRPDQQGERRRGPEAGAAEASRRPDGQRRRFDLCP